MRPEEVATTTTLHRDRRDIRLETATGTLVGTLTNPVHETDHAVLMIAGSGPTDRDGNSAVLPGRNDSLRMLASGLTSAGMATL